MLIVHTTQIGSAHTKQCLSESKRGGRSRRSRWQRQPHTATLRKERHLDPDHHHHNHDHLAEGAVTVMESTMTETTERRKEGHYHHYHHDATIATRLFHPSVRPAPWLTSLEGSAAPVCPHSASANPRRVATRSLLGSMPPTQPPSPSPAPAAAGAHASSPPHPRTVRRRAPRRGPALPPHRATRPPSRRHPAGGAQPARRSAAH